MLSDFKDVVEVKTLNHGHINLDKGSNEAKITRDFMIDVAAALKAGRVLRTNELEQILIYFYRNIQATAVQVGHQVLSSGDHIRSAQSQTTFLADW